MIKPYLTYKEDAMPDVWIKEAFTKDVAQTVLEDTKEVINNPHGTGYAACRTDITLAGKTGTAEYSMTDGEKTHSWFVGFTNLDNPELVISVIIEGYDGNAGAKAVPIAKQVLDSYYYQ